MGFQVIRVEKLKSTRHILSRVEHAMRKEIPFNADPEKVTTNGYGMGHSLKEVDPEERVRQVMERWKDLMPQKHRKDSVNCLEFVVSGTHESMAALKGMSRTYYLAESLNWIAERFGGSKNVLGYAFHRDEKTEHLSLFMIPLKDGRLSAKRFIDGPKDLAQLQTDFNNEVAKKYGLDRGRFNSPARHTSVKEFYKVGRERMKEIQQEREAWTIKDREEKQAKRSRNSGWER